jgi:hypothetical protein
VGLDEQLYLSTNSPLAATSTCRVTVNAEDSLHAWHYDVRELRKGMGYPQGGMHLHWWDLPQRAEEPPMPVGLLSEVRIPLHSTAPE